MVGEGTQREARAAGRRIRLADRVEFLGSGRRRGTRRAVRGTRWPSIYRPTRKTYGYVTLEAFLSRKPVITARDAGGPIEFVEDGANGIVCDPAPESLADAINSLAANRTRAASLGDAGYDRARTVTWDGVIEKLLGHL